MKKIQSYIDLHITNTKTIIQDSLKVIKSHYPHQDLVSDFIEPAYDIILSGKFIRPKMCILGSLLNRTLDSNSDEIKIDETLVQICAALELFHLSALIHDDIIDNTHIRRGKNSAHIHFQKKYQNNIVDKNYGTNAAILLGDLLLSKSFEHVSNIKINDLNQYKDICQFFTNITSEVAIGQYYDLYASSCDINEDFQLKTDLIKNILITKTSYYTVVKPFILGAKSSFSDDNLVLSIAEGLKLWGMAFQMKDDELGVFGDPLMTGKPNGNDLVEEKKTILLAYTLQENSLEKRKEIITLLPMLKNMSECDRNIAIENIKNEIICSKALDKHTNQINEYFEKGCEIINQNLFETKLKEYLLDFGNSLIKREK